MSLPFSYLAVSHVKDHTRLRVSAVLCQASLHGLLKSLRANYVELPPPPLTTITSSLASVVDIQEENSSRLAWKLELKRSQNDPGDRRHISLH